MGSLPSPMHSPANHNPMPYRNLPPSMLGSMGGMPPPPPTSMRGHMGQPNMADIARIGSMEPVDGGAADFLASLGALLGNGSSAGGRMEGGQEPGRSFDDLSQRVRDKVQSVLDHCAPHIRVSVFS